MSNLEEIHIQLKQLIVNVQECYQVAEDMHRSTSLKIEVGDSMFVLAKFIKFTQPSRKLAEKYLGPFEVTSKPSIHSYQI